MFGKLFGKSSKEKQDETKHSGLNKNIANSILGVVGARGIPVMPSAAQKAFQLSTDPNAEARDFVEVIESDESLSARVVKIANSVFFDRGKPSNTIEESVMVIGINELRCLLNATTLSEIFPSKYSARSQLWVNDIATGLISRTLASRFLAGKEDLAFLAGLMHDIGKLLLLQRSPTEYHKILEIVQNGEMNFCQAEAEVFPFDHTEVGQLVGEKWHFSEELLLTIRNHHQPWENLSFDPQGPPLAGIIKSADLVAHAQGFGHPKGFAKFQNACDKLIGEVWEYLNIPASERREVLQNLKKTFELEYDLYSGQV